MICVTQYNINILFKTIYFYNKIYTHIIIHINIYILYTLMKINKLYLIFNVRWCLPIFP